MNFIQIIKNNKQFQNFSIYGIGQFFNLITPLLVAPYVIKICGEDGFGKVGIGLSLVFILTVLIDFASGINGVKDVSIYRENSEKIKKIARTMFGLKFIALGIVVMLSIILIFFIPFLSKEKELLLLSLTLLLSQALNPIWFLQGIDKFKIISFITIISKVIYIILVLLFVVKKSDYIFVNFYFGLSSILVNIACLFWLKERKYLDFTLPKKEELTAIFKRDYKLTFSQLLLSLQQYSPIILIGYLGNTTLAGQYKIIEQIIMIFRTYLQVLFNFIYPRVCYLINQNIPNGIKKWFLYNGLSFLIVLFFSGILFFNAPKVLIYFNVSDISLMTYYLRFASIIPILFAVNFPLQQIVLAFNLQKQYVSITIWIAVFLILTIVSTFQLWQLTGIFSLLIISEVIVIFCYFYILRNNLFKGITVKLKL